MAVVAEVMLTVGSCCARDSRVHFNAKVTMLKSGSKPLPDFDYAGILYTLKRCKAIATSLLAAGVSIVSIGPRVLGHQYKPTLSWT